MGTLSTSSPHNVKTQMAGRPCKIWSDDMGESEFFLLQSFVEVAKMRIYVSFMRPCLVLSCLKAPLQLPQFMRPGQIHPCRRVHIVLKHQILHRSWIYSTMRRRMNAWKLDDTFMFMIVVVWWYFYDVGPHSFCHLTPSCPITLSEISRRWYHKRFVFCANWCPGRNF